MSVEIVSASAGSGKTYRLATSLQQALTRPDHPVAPEAVLATTFTNKAAAELQERARRFLLANGHVDLARRLAAARFGTVNAVCGRLVSDFALELGRPPEQGVLDEVAARVALRRSLSKVLTVEETFEIAELEARLPNFRVLDSVQKVIELARSNDVPTAAFAGCSDRSRAEVTDLLDAAAGTAGADVAAAEEDMDRALQDALQGFADGMASGIDKTKGAEKAMARVSKALARLRRGLEVNWDEWAALARLETTKSSQRLMDDVNEAAEGYLIHPRLRRDLATVSKLVCALAARGLDAYQEHKRANGLMDFVDQEALALDLLRRPDVRERLRGDLGLVLVDEFQDTSPLQLEIFLRLAELAPESLWVGDQKQSIFAFRGSDPALMESAMSKLLAGAAPATLGQSYRSRPALVRVTSALFARAFAMQGLPEERVRLEPKLTAEPAGLGPIAERWRFAVRNVDEDAASLATAMGELLADPSVRVRDLLTGEARPVEPRDVAVLCRRRATRDRVATALAARGIRSVLPRAGLLGTAEGQTLLAGLRLWSDPRDRLAAAALARLTELPGDGVDWLETALARPQAEAFFELPRAQRLLAARTALPAAGPLEAVDAIAEALDLPGLCADWGESAMRLANLDALRSHAVTFADLAQAEGGGATPAGLVSHLEQLDADLLDSQATVASRDAVTVSTWHGAKGLEWPIVVLFELDKDNEPTVFGITVERDNPDFDAEAPLAGRWLRLWPEIFHPMRKTTTLHQSLVSHRVAIDARRRKDAEDLRLLYVGWTRARDRVILAGRPTKILEGILRHLSDGSGLLLDDPEDGQARWAGTPVEVLQRSALPQSPTPRDPQPGWLYVAAGPREHPPAWLQPSSLTTPGEIARREELGPRLEIRGTWEEHRLGEVFHRFFAADSPSLAPEERLALASDLVARWGLAENLRPADLVESANRLRTWCERHHPGAHWRREWPLSRRDASGTVLRGAADLVLETAEGLVVIDHKAFSGSPDTVLEKARGAAGQVWSYAEALRAATGKENVACFIHLPVGGEMIEVGKPA